MAFFTQIPSIFIPTFNLGIKHIPLFKEVSKRTIGIPFKSGEKIMPVEKREYTDLPRFEGDNKYCVHPRERFTVINSLSGFYNEDREFQIQELQIPDGSSVTHYLINGTFYDTVSRKDVENTLYVPIESIHGRFQLLDH